MFESIKFQNFKALRNTTLPLSRFTLIVGPNGSGKTSALTAFFAFQNPGLLSQNRTAGVSDQQTVRLLGDWKSKIVGVANATVITEWGKNIGGRGPMFQGYVEEPQLALQRARFYSLDATAIAASVALQPQMELS